MTARALVVVAALIAACIPPPAVDPGPPAPRDFPALSGALPVSLPHCQLVVHLDPARRWIAGHAVTTLRHHRRHRLVFFLRKELSLREVLLDGRPAHATSTTASLPYVKDVRAYAVDPRGQPARHVTRVTVAYQGQMPAEVAEVNSVGPELVELALYAGWYPVFHGAGMLSNTLEVHLPSTFKVVARGHRVSTWDTGQGRMRTHAERWRADVPGHDITLLAAPRFRTLRRGPVRLVFVALPATLARRILDLSHAALQELRARHGAPGIDAVQIVLSPRAGWNYSRPGLIVVSEKRLQGATEAVLRERVHGVAHEIGHLWWHANSCALRSALERGPAAPRAADPTTDDDWINEALAEYAALRATETLFGPRQAQAWRERYFTELQFKPPPVSILRTTSDSEFRYASWHMRGALLFNGLEHQVGRTRLDAFLRELHQTTGPLTTGALRRRLRAALGQAAATWFEAELEAGVPTRAWLVRRRVESAARTARLAELRFVTDALERVYSHLALKQKRHPFDYGELRRTIEDRVTRATTDVEYQAALTDLLAAFHDGHLKLLLRDAPPATRATAAAVSHHMLPGRILLTRIARLFGDTRAIQRQLKQGLARLTRARALVIDLRGNPGGSNRIAFDYVARLIRRPVVLGHSTVRLSPEVLAQRPHYAEIYPPDLSRPGFSRPREARLEPQAPLAFAGPIAVLVDHGCYSACESTALALKLGGARLYGQATGGGSANPMTLDLPHTPGKLQVPTWIFVKPDGEPLEDHGVMPHVVLPAGQDAQTVALAELPRRLKP